MKKLSVWVLILLLAMALFVGAAAKDLIIEYDRTGEQAVAAEAMPGGDAQDMPEYADNR